MFSKSAFSFISVVEVMPVPCPHFNVKIVQRSRGQSAIAAAAYQSGSRLFSENDHKVKWYSNKKEVVHAEILFPPHVPAEYFDREILWNAVEKSEKRFDAQLARRIVLALPREIPREAQINLLLDYCSSQFVSRGMIADIAIHDKGDGNPHAHILLTMRAMDKDGKFLPKSRMVYDLDANGQKQKTARGNYKCHKENTTDWDNRNNVRVWRAAWEEFVNRAYEENNRPERVSLSSYEKSGSPKIPTVHMGPAVTQMEKRGIRTNIGNLNRDIFSHNREIANIRRDIRAISARLEKLLPERDETALALFPQDKPRTLVNLLFRYYDIRKDGRESWSRYAQKEADITDLRQLAHVICWLQNEKIDSLQTMNERFGVLRSEAGRLTDTVKSLEAEIRMLEIRIKHKQNLTKYKPVYDKYKSIFFESRKKDFEQDNILALDKYRAAVRYFGAHPGYRDTPVKELSARQEKARKELDDANRSLSQIKTSMEPYEQVSYYLSKANAARPFVPAYFDHPKQTGQPAQKKQRSEETL